MVKITDLSHRLIPGRQRFKLDIMRYAVDEYIPGYQVAPGEWYIMEDMLICTHTGTHVEAPYHADEHGTQVADIDIHRFIGEAAILDFTDKKYEDSISAEEIEDRGKHVKSGDIVLIKTGLSRFYGTPDYKRPYLKTDAIEYLINKGIKLLGVDCSGIENKSINSMQINHRKLFDAGIPLIEDMNNLIKLKNNRIFFITLPLSIEGLDACPLRPIAIEPIEAGIKLPEVFLDSDTEWDGFNIDTE